MGIGGRYRVIAVGLCLWAVSSAAWADGGFIGKRDLYEPEQKVSEQKAAILFVDGLFHPEDCRAQDKCAWYL